MVLPVLPESTLSNGDARGAAGSRGLAQQVPACCRQPKKEQEVPTH